MRQLTGPTIRGNDSRRDLCESRLSPLPVDAEPTTFGEKAQGTDAGHFVLSADGHRQLRHATTERMRRVTSQVVERSEGRAFAAKKKRVVLRMSVGTQTRQREDEGVIEALPVQTAIFGLGKPCEQLRDLSNSRPAVHLILIRRGDAERLTQIFLMQPMPSPVDALAIVPFRDEHDISAFGPLQEVVGDGETELPRRSHRHELVDVMVGARRNGGLEDVCRRGGVVRHRPASVRRAKKRHFGLRTGKAPSSVVATCAPRVSIANEVGDQTCEITVGEFSNHPVSPGSIVTMFTAGQNLYGSRGVTPDSTEEREGVGRADLVFTGELFDSSRAVGKQSLR